jgi:hypothetical protein
MRFLYGDSSPFPPQHDFLATLEAVLEQAVIAVSHEAEASAAMRKAEESGATRGQSVEELDTVHASFMASARHAASQTINKATSPVYGYATRMGEEAERLYAETKRSVDAISERERNDARIVSEQKRGTIRSAIEALLIKVRLPVMESRVTMNLEGERGDGCTMSTVLVHPDNLVTSFQLVPPGDWQKARHVSDFATGVTLPVGLKRSLFKRTAQHEPITLDEWVLGGFDVADETCELRLRRKPAEKDSLVFNLRAGDSGTYAEVHHPGETGTEALPPVLDAQDAVQLERFWTLLRSACGPLQAHRSRLISALLEGRDVFESNSATKLVVMIVKQLAPIAQEISRRSPNPAELSLKIEDDGGKRQEIYLKKSLLGAKLGNVPFSERHVFEPLDFLAKP